MCSSCEDLDATGSLFYSINVLITHQQKRVQDMDNNDSLAMAIATFLGKITGIVLKYVCLAGAIAWGIHLASTL